MSADWINVIKLAFQILGVASFVFLWLLAMIQLIGLVREQAKPVDTDEADLLWSVTGDGGGERLPDFDPELERLCVPNPHALESAATEETQP